MRRDETDIKTGAHAKFNKTKHKINKCSRFIMKVTMVFLIVIIYIGYFMAISTNLNIIGNIHDFAAAYVIDSSINGISFG